MSYTPTIAATKQALVTLLADALSSSAPSGGPVTVAYAWSPGTTAELAVFLTRPPLEGDDRRMPVSYTVPVMQPGAQPFEENYRIDLTVWSWRPDLQPDDAYTVEAQVDSVVGVILETLADNVTGVGGSRWTLPDAGGENDLAEYEKGWVCRRTIPLDVSARLQP